MPQLQLDHVAVAVRSIKAALPLYRDALGGEYLMGGDADGSWRWVQLRFPGGGKVELLEPLEEGFLTRFLERYGEGLHHITFKTDDIREAVEEVERRLLVATLDHHRGDKQRTAQILGIGLRSLYRKVKQYEIGA